MISVYNKMTSNELNLRKLETLDKYNKLIQWGRANPTRFIEAIFKIQLFDYQKWVIMNSWAASTVGWVCSRSTGKTFMGGIYIMAKNMLFPKYKTVIMAPTGRQSFETFEKMEDIAKKNISSLVGSTDVFLNEVVRQQANSDGFTHDKQGRECTLFNGSKIRALVGKEKNVVGIRSNLNFYDEAGKLPEEYYGLTEPFTAQDRSLKTGTNIDTSVIPIDIPNQNLYASSAEDDESHLWKIYVDCAKKMMMGYKDYFVADINCEIPLNPFMNGERYKGSVITQQKVDDAMESNSAKALREYYNIFDRTGGVELCVKRSDIHRNEQDYLPVLDSEGKDKHYVIAYDPAAQADNSILLVAEVYKDLEKGWKGKIVNAKNLIDKEVTGKKFLLRTPEQLEVVRKFLLKYNGKNPEYSNVNLIIDAGAGGAGRPRADLLMSSWVDIHGKKHKGIIDLQDTSSKMQELKFPEAANINHLSEPQKDKTSAFFALSELTSLDLIDFPMAFTGKRDIEIDGIKHTLSEDEIEALVEIDLMKEEISSIHKTKTDKGIIKYGLPPEKARRMHDDRAYCMALIALYISKLRKEDSYEADEDGESKMKVLLETYKAGKPLSGAFSSSNPFQGKNNPFKK